MNIFLKKLLKNVKSLQRPNIKNRPQMADIFKTYQKWLKYFQFKYMYFLFLNFFMFYLLVVEHAA